MSHFDLNEPPALLDSKLREATSPMVNFRNKIATSPMVSFASKYAFFSIYKDLQYCLPELSKIW
jgi:hypothetical protein